MQCGFGVQQPVLAVYIENCPPMSEYHALSGIQALSSGEIEMINSHCGNGWRKVFNVYAKLLFALDPVCFTFSQQAASWQQYRDHHLLQKHSSTALLFSMPDISERNKETIHLIAGRTYAKKCLVAGLNCQLNWLSHDFAIDQQHKVLVSPYFDYRQLTNEKIHYLATLIKGCASGI